ncbi:MAG TPA: type III-A CRISPR-associated protein Csm2 [Bryobacteraceae bacterium]|nr:type III-A CRISPR-associated protein Csm2 [Bryobacteraceae bacterium]
MEEEVQTEAPPAAAEAAPAAEPARQEPPKPAGEPGKREERPRRDDRPPRGPQAGGARPAERGRGEERRPDDRRSEERRGDRREGGRPGGGRPFEGPPEIEIEKLISDSLYLDNQAHAIVARMRDMDSGTKSQLRRLYNAVRRAVRAPENERQHQFVMLRARLAYTIARHSLRSLDALERLLLQVTRKNDARGYERFKDLFEAIVAYNE